MSQIQPPPPSPDVTGPGEITYMDEGCETLIQNNPKIISQPTPLNITSLPDSPQSNIVNIFGQNVNFITPHIVRSTFRMTHGADNNHT